METRVHAIQRLINCAFDAPDGKHGARACDHEMRRAEGSRPMARGAGPPGHVKPDASLGARCVDSACGTRPASTDGGRGQARGAQILETETGGEFGRQLLDAYESNWVKQTQLGLQKHSFRLYFVDCKIKKERTFHSNGVQTNRVLAVESHTPFRFEHSYLRLPAPELCERRPRLDAIVVGVQRA